jgi:predicted Zn-ribbon and HTH transcriptional regulator
MDTALTALFDEYVPPTEERTSDIVKHLVAAWHATDVDVCTARFEVNEAVKLFEQLAPPPENWYTWRRAIDRIRWKLAERTELRPSMLFDCGDCGFAWDDRDPTVQRCPGCGSHRVFRSPAHNNPSS